MAQAFYSRDGERFVPTELTRGPWDPKAQHAGPPSALLGRAIERHPGIEGAQVGRITFEILGPVPLEPLAIDVETVRGGRSVELIHATLSGPGGAVMRAAAWRLATRPVDLDPPPPAESPLPGPGEGHEGKAFPAHNEFGYHMAMEHRFLSGDFLEPGPATVWMRMRHPLLEDEEPSALTRVLVAADTGNGVSATLDWNRFLFINTELSVHLVRMPVGEWVCLDAVTHAADHGVGLTETALWDEKGRIGRASQALLVRARG